MKSIETHARTFLPLNISAIGSVVNYVNDVFFLGCASAAQPHMPMFFRCRCHLVVLLSCLGFRAKEAIEAIVGVAGNNTNDLVIVRE